MIADAGTALIIVWVTFAAIALAAIVAVLVWAVRSRQFSDQDRARRLPLQSGIPDREEPDRQEAGRKDSPAKDLPAGQAGRKGDHVLP